MRLFIMFGPGRAFIMIWDGGRGGGVDGGVGCWWGRLDGRSGWGGRWSVGLGGLG